MNTETRALTIIDGSGFIYRAFHALPPLTTAQGVSIGAVAGFISMMLKWHEAHSPIYGLVVFDSGRSVSRQELFPQYKAHRAPTPPELLSQFPLIDEFCTHMALPSVRCPGVEADDLIASITHHMVGLGWQVNIVTSDKDLCQLAQPGVTLHDPLKKRSLSPDDVTALWGVSPDRIADVQALAGDSADGIPGIPGIGIKTATAWIQQFGSLEGVLTHAHALPTPKKQALVQEYANQARLCYQLAQLQGHHWQPTWQPESHWLWPRPKPYPQLMAWLEQHQLVTLAQRLRHSGWVQSGNPSTIISGTVSSGAFNPSTVSSSSVSPEALAGPLETEASSSAPSPRATDGTAPLQPSRETMNGGQAAVGGAKHGAVDSSVGSTESSGSLVTSLDASVESSVNASVRGPSLGATSMHCLASLPIPTPAQGHALIFHDPQRAVECIIASPAVVIYPDKDEIYVFWAPHHWSKGLLAEHWSAVWAAEGCAKISHDVKSLRHGLRHLAPFDTIDGDGVWDDLMLLSYAVYGHTRSHDLATLLAMMDGNEKGDHAVGQDVASSLCQRPPEEVAAAMYVLWTHLMRLVDLCHVATPYYATDRPLTPVLAQMEAQGVCIDVDGLARLDSQWSGQCQLLLDRIMALAGCSFNPASPKQLGHVLFDQLGWPKSKKSSKTGSYVVDSDVLSSLAQQGYELASVLLEWRQLNKLMTTYVKGLQEHIVPATQRIHTTFNMVTTSTGRLSSHDPNVQNIPIRTERGRALRRLFVAPAGYVFLSLDYAQIELCLLAHMGPVASLQRAFAQKVDIHAQTAVDLFSTTLHQVTPDQRRTAKSINFGILYGMSAFGLAQQLRLTRPEAKHLIDRYFHTYPEVKDYIQRMQEHACRHGYVRTQWGRMCWIPGANHPNAMVRAAATRQAVNAPLQGTSADIIKRAMILAHQWMREVSFDVSLVLQIHDELIFQVAQNHVEHVINPLKSIMQAAAPDMPLCVNVTWGPTLDFESAPDAGSEAASASSSGIAALASGRSSISDSDSYADLSSDAGAVSRMSSVSESSAGRSSISGSGADLSSDVGAVSRMSSVSESSAGRSSISGSGTEAASSSGATPQDGEPPITLLPLNHLV